MSITVVPSSEQDLTEKPVKKERRIEFFKGTDGDYYIRKVVIANGKTVGDFSQGYHSKYELEHAWNREKRFLKLEYFDGPVWVDDTVPPKRRPRKQK